MTVFGIYLIIYYIVNLLIAIWYLGRGRGYEVTTGILAFATVWTAFNLVGLVLWGSGFGILS